MKTPTTQLKVLAMGLVAMTAATLVIATPTPAEADEEDDGVRQLPAWQLQRFRPAPGAADYVTVYGTGIAPHMDWSAGTFFNYADYPMYVPGGRGVNYQAQLDVAGTIGLYDIAEVGLTIPWTMRQRDADLDPGADADHLAQTALNDFRVTSKFQILDLSEYPVGVAAVAGVSLPLGNDNALGGDGGFGGEVSAVGEYVFYETIRASANLGFRYRPGERRVQDNVLGNELTWGVGVHSPFITDNLDVVGEIYGSVAVQPRPDHLSGISEGEVPAELLGALRYGVLDDWSISAGMTAGLTDGVGTPNWRAFLGIDGKWATGGWWRVDYRNPQFEVQTDPCEGWDPDETVRRLRFDPVEDCPDDTEPISPHERAAELDDPVDTGWEPDQPEPTAEELEDREGDALIDQGAILIRENITFETGSAEIRGESHDILDDVATLIQRRDEIGLLRVEGHTDSVGNAQMNLELSEDRAESVRQYLIEAGVQPELLESVGYGESKPVADNDTAEGRAQNRRVEFHIMEMR